VPRRRCVGCGRIAPKSELVRLAVADRRPAGEAGERRSHRAVIDAYGALPGRGAYLCRGSDPSTPDPSCLRLATRRGGIARTLRRAVQLDLGDSSDRDPEFVESIKRVAQSAEGRLAETGTRAEGECLPASVGPLCLQIIR
jgi:predicted RNA-binding protein YlxR (DUF448 family)